MIVNAIPIEAQVEIVKGRNVPSSPSERQLHHSNGGSISTNISLARRRINAELGKQEELVRLREAKRQEQMRLREVERQEQMHDREAQLREQEALIELRHQAEIIEINERESQNQGSHRSNSRIMPDGIDVAPRDSVSRVNSWIASIPWNSSRVMPLTASEAIQQSMNAQPQEDIPRMPEGLGIQSRPVQLDTAIQRATQPPTNVNAFVTNPRFQQEHTDQLAGQVEQSPCFQVHDLATALS